MYMYLSLFKFLFGIWKYRTAGNIGGNYLAVGSQIAILKHIGGFKLGSSVWDRHMYVCELEILVDFNLVVTEANNQTAKIFSYTVVIQQ